jgi:hypothetical protein
VVDVRDEALRSGIGCRPITPSEFADGPLLSLAERLLPDVVAAQMHANGLETLRVLDLVLHIV